MSAKKVKRRRRKSIALSVYFIYIMVMLLLLVVVLAFIWFKLDKYQKNLDAQKAAREAAEAEAAEAPAADDEKASQQAFMEYAEELTVETWTEEWFKAYPADPESDETVKTYFDNLLADIEPKYYKAATYSDDAPVYKIKLDDKDAALVCVSKAAGVWSVSDIELVYSGDYDISEELPEGLSLEINGMVVSHTDEEGRSLFPYNGMKELLENPLLWYDYEAAGMLTEPQQKITGEVEYDYSEEDGCYVIYTADAGGELAAKGEAFFTAYMNYTMSGGAGWKDYKAAKEAIEAGEAAEGAELPGNPVQARMNAACALTPSDSIAWSMLYKAYDSTCYGLAYKDHDYGLISTGKPVYWAENCVSIDYAYHAYATLNGQRKDYSGEDQLFRVYFLKKNGAWRIWAFDA